MARKFGPFDTSQFYEVENRRLQRAFNPQTGFVKSGQGAVTAGTGAQLIIAAYPDGALIDGMYVENPTTETVALTTNSGNTNPRVDRLVLRLDMTAKTIAPFQIVGTPAATPVAPPLVNTGTVVDLPLCRYTMPGSASAQNPSTILDERGYIAGTAVARAGALAVAQTVPVGGTYSWNGVQNFPVPFIGAVMRAELSMKVTFPTASPQTLRVNVGIGRGTAGEGDHDHDDRVPGAPGSGPYEYLFRRYQFFTATEQTVDVNYAAAVGSGGSAVVISNPRCVVTGPYRLV